MNHLKWGITLNVNALQRTAEYRSTTLEITDRVFHTHCQKRQRVDQAWNDANAQCTLMLISTKKMKAAAACATTKLSAYGASKEEKDSRWLIKSWYIIIAQCRLFFISIYRCIMENVCTQPHCAHGTYSVHYGRCPDRNDKLRRGFERPKQ